MSSYKKIAIALASNKTIAEDGILNFQQIHKVSAYIKPLQTTDDVFLKGCFIS